MEEGGANTLEFVFGLTQQLDHWEALSGFPDALNHILLSSPSSEQEQEQEGNPRC